MSIADLNHAIETECNLLAAAQDVGNENAANFHRGAIAAYASMKVRQETENERTACVARALAKESTAEQGNSMLSTDKVKILDICNRFGDHELMKFIREAETSDIVDMLEKNGNGDALVDWFKEAYPEDFQTESAEDRAYWDNADFRHDSAREDAVLNAG